MIIAPLIIDPADPIIKGENSFGRNPPRGHANLIDIIQLLYIIYLDDLFNHERSSYFQRLKSHV
jgi:hypothetical protein